MSGDSPDKMNVDIILNRHACRLLSSYRLFDLACFAANLDDYQLVSWLRKERLAWRAESVKDIFRIASQSSRIYIAPQSSRIYIVPLN